MRFWLKWKKSGQTTKADLPTIGVNTVEKCYESKIIGIAIQANTTLVLDKENIIKKADELGLFITVIKWKKPLIILKFLQIYPTKF